MDSSKPQRYYIPDNFLGESKILKGAFKTRNFVEGVLLMIIPLLIALMIPTSSFSAQIVLVIFFTAPFFLLGVAGFNGDPLSATVMSLYNWADNKDVLIYNKKAKVLTSSPLDNMMAEQPNKDKILTYLEQKREVKRAINSKKTYIEGIDFEFADEKDAYIKYADVKKKDQKGDDADFYEREKLVSDNDSIIEDVSTKSVDKKAEIKSADVEFVDIAEVEEVEMTTNTPEVEVEVEEVIAVEAVEAIEVEVPVKKRPVYKADFSVIDVEEVEVSQVFV